MTPLDERVIDTCIRRVTDGYATLGSFDATEREAIVGASDEHAAVHVAVAILARRPAELHELTTGTRAYVEGYADAHGLRVEWAGEIGFGRECVGLLDGKRDSYVAYPMEYGEPAAPPPGVEDAYHKSHFIAVLGRGRVAEEQLLTWVRSLAKAGVRFEYRQKEIPDLSTLVFGHTDELTAVRGEPRG